MSKIYLYSDVHVYNVIDNFKFFSKNLEQIIPEPGGIFELIRSSFQAEFDIVKNLRRVGKMLAKHNQNEDAARKDCGTVLDMLFDLMKMQDFRRSGKAYESIFYFYSVDEFDFWLNIYKNMHYSRALVKYGCYF